MNHEISYLDSIGGIIQVLKENIGKTFVVYSKGDRIKRTGTIVEVTDQMVVFQFALGRHHKEICSYLLSDIWRGYVKIDGISFNFVVAPKPESEEEVLDDDLAIDDFDEDIEENDDEDELEEDI